MLLSLVGASFDHCEWPDSVVTAEEVHQAVMEAKDGRTCASVDLLVAEAWKASTLADPRLSG